jgi:hypothetical protein
MKSMLTLTWGTVEHDSALGHQCASDGRLRGQSEPDNFEAISRPQLGGLGRVERKYMLYSSAVPWAADPER